MGLAIRAYRLEEVAANARAIAALPDLIEANIVAIECGDPEKFYAYDKEGVDAWRWAHPDGREWAEISPHDDPAPPHPLIVEALLKAGCTE